MIIMESMRGYILRPRPRKRFFPGMDCNWVLLVLIICHVPYVERACGLGVLGNAKNRHYVKHPSWSETLCDSRARYQTWWQEKLGGVRLSPWYLPPSAPQPGLEGNTFKLKTKVVLGQRIDLNQRDRQGKACWQRRPDLIDGVIHYDLSNHGIGQQRVLPQQMNPSSGPISSLTEDFPLLVQVRTITSNRARRMRVWLGAQNGIELWLNNKRVYANYQLGNGLQPQADMASVLLDLNESENQLILRLVGSRWEGFYFSPFTQLDIHPDWYFDVMDALRNDFPVETAQLRADVSEEILRAWFRGMADVHFLKILQEKTNPISTSDETLLAGLRSYAHNALNKNLHRDLKRINLTALKRAIHDLARTYSNHYTDSDKLLTQLDRYDTRLQDLHKGLDKGGHIAAREIGQILAFQRQVLLSNPLLDFDELLLIKRKPLGPPRRAKAPNRGMGEFLGLPQQSSWQLDRIRQPFGWDNEIVAMTVPRGVNDETAMRTLYTPPTPRLISDIDLHFDAHKLLFSMPGSNLLWQVFEMNTDGSVVRQLSPVDQPDVQNFDAAYLPNDKIVFVSTAPFQGVPCSDGIAVAVAYIMDRDGKNIRQLCFDQDHDYCPTVMNDGRILYLRWDYTDLPHQWPRILFTMNPDGSGQREYYGSGSYWPNAIFFARPVPNHPTKVAGIVTGHHVGRVGELVIFDPARGRHEADGVVQRIGGYGQKVDPIIMDKLTIDTWPKFLHPYPLSEKYFLVSCKPTPEALWGIYLVDVFDNFLLLKEMEGYGLFEPIPGRKRVKPPIIPTTVDLTRKDALMYIENIYKGPGLHGVPRGTVKNLRVFSYYFAYPYKSGGQHRVGADGPWEPKRILGTVPVEADGSAFFRVPANLPISMQPLDAEGKALQLMRSWTTAMPGELVSCVGCHEGQNSAPVGQGTVAAQRIPSELQPWHGPVRGFSFKREVQPVLDRYCVVCHNGEEREGQRPVDLRANQDGYVVFGAQNPKPAFIAATPKSELVQDYAGVFEPSYIALRSLIRVGGLESDLHLLNPGEFNADTTELIQMLKKGHYGVELDATSWERLYAWIDLNGPCHGNWQETVGLERMTPDHGRRLDLRRLYGGSTDDPERVDTLPLRTDAPTGARENNEVPVSFTAIVNSTDNYKTLQATTRHTQNTGRSRKKNVPSIQSIRLGKGMTLDMVYIPAGEFVMGDPQELSDERPASVVRIEKPFWMSRHEITNEQYALFDPSHDSRHEHGTASFNSERALGPKLNKPTQPVVRVSWKEAMAFGQWLTRDLHENNSALLSSGSARATLPTEAQWEYACRAGTSTAFHFGGLDDDFSHYANVSDATMNGWATYNEKRRSVDIVPRDARFNDRALVSTQVGSYKPNPWLLHDMHGNVSEWTRSDYTFYPYNDHDGRNIIDVTGNKAVRGGSWYDRPKRCRSAFRLSYPAWRKVYNVGFRIIVESDESI